MSSWNLKEPLSRLKDVISPTTSTTKARRRRSSVEASASAPGLLIYQTRPASIPPKTKKEEAKHRQLVAKQINLSKTKLKAEHVALENSIAKVRKREDTSAATLQDWNAKILPNWEALRSSRQVHMSCWSVLGLPAAVRGRVWDLCSVTKGNTNNNSNTTKNTNNTTIINNTNDTDNTNNNNNTTINNTNGPNNTNNNNTTINNTTNNNTNTITNTSNNNTTTNNNTNNIATNINNNSTTNSTTNTNNNNTINNTNITNTSTTSQTNTTTTNTNTNKTNNSTTTQTNNINATNTNNLNTNTTNNTTTNNSADNTNITTNTNTTTNTNITKNTTTTNTTITINNSKTSNNNNTATYKNTTTTIINNNNNNNANNTSNTIANNNATNNANNTPINTNTNTITITNTNINTNTNTNINTTNKNANNNDRVYDLLEIKVHALAKENKINDRCHTDGDMRREWTLENISMDVKRTFPHLAVLDEGGPLHEPVRNLCAIYALQNMRLGYVQGMSYLAATVALNLEKSKALRCLEKVLNIQLVRGFHEMEHTKMSFAFDTMRLLTRKFLPKIHAHFTLQSVLPEYFLNEWIMTVFSKTLPVDISMKIWDILFINNFQEHYLFIFSLAILKMMQTKLLLLEFTDIMIALKHPFDEYDVDTTSEVYFELAKSISLSHKTYLELISSPTTST